MAAAPLARVRMRDAEGRVESYGDCHWLRKEAGTPAKVGDKMRITVTEVSNITEKLVSVPGPKENHLTVQC